MATLRVTMGTGNSPSYDHSVKAVGQTGESTKVDEEHSNSHRESIQVYNADDVEKADNIVEQMESTTSVEQRLLKIQEIVGKISSNNGNVGSYEPQSFLSQDDFVNSLPHTSSSYSKTSTSEDSLHEIGLRQKNLALY